MMFLISLFDLFDILLLELDEDDTLSLYSIKVSVTKPNAPFDYLPGLGACVYALDIFTGASLFSSKAFTNSGLCQIDFSLSSIIFMKDAFC